MAEVMSGRSVQACCCDTSAREESTRHQRARRNHVQIGAPGGRGRTHPPDRRCGRSGERDTGPTRGRVSYCPGPCSSAAAAVRPNRDSLLAGTCRTAPLPAEVLYLRLAFPSLFLGQVHSGFPLCVLTLRPHGPVSITTRAGAEQRSRRHVGQQPARRSSRLALLSCFFGPPWFACRWQVCHCSCREEFVMLCGRRVQAAMTGQWKPQRIRLKMRPRSAPSRWPTSNVIRGQGGRREGGETGRP